MQARSRKTAGRKTRPSDDRRRNAGRSSSRAPRRARETEKRPAVGAKSAAKDRTGDRKTADAAKGRKKIAATGRARGGGKGVTKGSVKGAVRGVPARLHDGPQIIDWIGDVAKIVLVVIVILYSISFSGQAYEIGYSIFYEEAVDEEGDGVEIEVTITEDMSVAQIGSMLEEMGLLLDGSVFQYQELFSSSHGQITAGTYTLTTDMTPSDIIRALAENYEEEEEEETG